MFFINNFKKIHYAQRNFYAGIQANLRGAVIDRQDQNYDDGY